MVEETIQVEEQVEEKKVAISIKDLKKSFGKNEVLKGINLEIEPGTLFGLIGNVSSGKSTMINCLIGSKKFEGTIKINGHDIVKNPVKAKKSYGFVASKPVCYEMMTGYDYLEFTASVYGLSEETFRQNYKFLATRLSLKPESLKKPISALSAGDAQKICIIASLLINPEVWILDEPALRLDLKSKLELRKMLREYVSHGKTVFITSHDVDVVSKLCDRVAIIKDGEIVRDIDLVKDPNKRIQLNKIYLELVGD